MECTLLKYVKTADGEQLSDAVITMISRFLRSKHPCAREISKLTVHRCDDGFCEVYGGALRILDQVNWPPQYKVDDHPFLLFKDGEPYAWRGERAAMEAARMKRYGSFTTYNYYDSDDGF
jgi:hypothetical protein